MTGGMLPAATWHDIMAFAHQGIDAKPPFGVDDTRKPAVVAAQTQGDAIGQSDPAIHTASLSRRSASIIVDIGALMRSAGQERSAGGGTLDLASGSGDLAQPGGRKTGLQ